MVEMEMFVLSSFPPSHSSQFSIHQKERLFNLGNAIILFDDDDVISPILMSLSTPNPKNSRPTFSTFQLGECNNRFGHVMYPGSVGLLPVQKIPICLGFCLVAN